MPKGVHFTIGFDKRSSDINLHVTHNHSNPKDKPQIKIVLIDKNHLKEITPSFLIALYYKVLRPFDFDELRIDKKQELDFILFDLLETPEFSSLIEKDLVDSFKDISRFRKKTRLKIDGDIENRIESIASSENLQKIIYEKLTKLDVTKKSTKAIDGGILFANNEIHYLIKIYKNWFNLNLDYSPFELLTEFVEPILAKHLVWKTKRAIIQVKNSKCYADTEKFNNPIRLVR